MFTIIHSFSNSYLHLFVIFVFLHVKGTEIEKAVHACLGHALQAVQNVHVVGTLTGRGIVKGWRRSNRHGALRVAHGRFRTTFFRCDQIQIESPVGLFRRTVQIQQLPGANEENGVRALGRYGIGVKANDGELAQLVVEFVTEPSELSEIEGTEIQKEIPVNEFIVNVEKVNLLLVALIGRFGATRSRCENIVTGWRLLQGSKVQPFLIIFKN
jgi:hypothetical protein